MSLVQCSHNLTLGAPVFEGDFTKIRDGNVLTGLIGDVWDKLIVSKNHRNCYLVPVYDGYDDDESVTKSSNGFNMLGNKLIDLLMIPYKLGFLEQTEQTKVAWIEEYHVGQFLKKKNIGSLDVSQFLVENLRLVVIILLGYLLIVIVTSTLPRLVHRSYSPLKSLQLILYRVHFLEQSQLPKISFKVATIFLFFNFFLFITLNLLVNCIKTDKVVVPTDEIIDSPSKLLESSKLVTIDKNKGYLLKTAPEGTFLAKLAKRNIRINGNNSEERQNEFNKLGVSGYAFFFDQNVLIFIMSFLIRLINTEDMYIFRKPLGYHEVPHSYHMRQDLDEERKSFIHRVTERQFESGLISDVFEKTRAAIMAPMKKEIKIYEFTGSYVADRSNEVSPNLEFQNVKVLFVCFFGFLALIVFMFLVQNFLIPAIKKRRKLVRLRRRRIERQKMREALALANRSNRPEISGSLGPMSQEQSSDQK